MSTTDAPSGHVGRSLRRKEDPRLITGRGRYTDDISLPGTLWASFVRSPEAHAKITSIDVTTAAERHGVSAVFTNADMDDLAGPLPMAWVPPGVEVKNPEHWPLAKATVNHVGDPVAVVLGDDRYAGRRRGRGRGRRIRVAACHHRPGEGARGRAVRARRARHQQGARVVAVGRRPRRRLRRRRCDHRAPGRQPPHRRRPDRAPRRAGRLSGRLTDRLELDPGAALPAAVPLDPARVSARSACA